ncbi:MAG: quinolinate synthase NadA [Chlorobium sp.]|uniref:quinolinate synthase NadA n=1 Tax=Chlorobium sp. TaxID=1095 RepID=UPI0025B9794E|nr:quinolinate synthase NadA [Chlorobium sp.]MCF8216134.1 quinolinate synthase NadA [Chlorobium sp.]MCF8271095.1 quinolinate synthase NadA [Chlorobium sp.]MCF8287409.1 quinolinate synthase NadA [Chlorobium sp.]MCF8291008.1 quinolinate synthase NadA [Chlorobium sp.]MCF8385103.1 quinolinate synthase NadA [Chlorobium sp.]
MLSQTAVPSTTAIDELKLRVQELKRELNAILLAHYYTLPEIQQVADVVGDSLALARSAEKTGADVIVFAGVWFMAETAKILNPDKLVLVPDAYAGCPLADSCPVEEYRRFRLQHPEAVAVSYINSSAEIKSLSDIICTSSNAERIISSIPPDRKIIFGPDRNLGGYLMKKLGRDMLLWQGFCYVHEAFAEEHILAACRQHPEALLIAHPECRQEVLRHAVFTGSTQALLDYTVSSSAQSFIVATEPGILFEMQRRSPGKTFIPAPKDTENPRSVCKQMKQNTLDKLVRCMQERAPEVTLPEELRNAALQPIKRMLELSA